MNLFNFAGIIGDAIADTWMSIWLSLNNLVYNVIEALYKVFVSVANVNLFSEDAFNKITSRIYVVMGIAMLFIFAYNLVLMIINPEDKKSTGQMTKIVKETIISLVLIVLLPTIFNYMAIIQRHVLDSNILGQIILGDTGGTTVGECEKYKEYTIINDKTDIGDKKFNYEWYDWILNASPVVGIVNTAVHVIDYFIQSPTLPTDYLYNSCLYYSTVSPSIRGASSIAPTLFLAFYHPTNYGFYECQEYIEKCKGDSSCTTDKIQEEDDKKMCAYYYYDVRLATFSGSLKPFNEESYFYSKVRNNDDNFEFNYLLAFVAGCFAVYTFVCYTLAIGVRVAKLGFLQIISPIAVMMRVIPKQKEAVFDKWLKNVKDTYLDVFMRLIIIYFSMFAISLVPDVINALFTSFEGNFIVKSLSAVVVILGILKFAGDAPGLIKEFVGNSGNFSIKSPRKQLQENKLAMKGFGAIAGGIGSGVVGGFRNYKKTEGDKGAKILSAAGGVAGGIFRGGAAGYKNGVNKSGQTISSTADNLDASREKHKALRQEGVLNHIKSNLKDNKDNFFDFLYGNVASSELGNAANSIMVDVDTMENDFSNANISNIKAGRSEIMKKFNADQDFKFNGKQYHKVDANNWSDENGNRIEHKNLGAEIADSYKNKLAAAYAQNQSKAGIYEGFKRANESMLKDLRAAMPKFGEEFSKKLFDNLNHLKDVNGLDMNLNVKSLDELEDRMQQLINRKNSEGNPDQDALASIYMINDEIKSLAKGVKISNDQALKAQQASKNNKTDK